MKSSRATIFFKNTQREVTGIVVRSRKNPLPCGQLREDAITIANPKPVKSYCTMHLLKEGELKIFIPKSTFAQNLINADFVLLTGGITAITGTFGVMIVLIQGPETSGGAMKTIGLSLLLPAAVIYGVPIAFLTRGMPLRYKTLVARALLKKV